MNLKWMNSEQGKSRALNMALFHAEGKYIIHIDSDGILHPEALSNLVKRFEAHNELHCMTGTILDKSRNDQGREESVPSYIPKDGIL